MKPWVPLAALGAALVLIAGLSRPPDRAPSVGMSTATKTKKPAAKTAAERARRAKLARIRRAEDKADLAIARKRLADIDAGKAKVLTREEFLREMDV